MGEPDVPERIKRANDSINRYEMGERLEAENKRITGVRRAHFVDQKSLCSSCKYASMRRQESRNARIVHCSVFGKQMPEDVIECTDYAAFGTLSLTQMAEIATIIDDRSDQYRGYL